jgi:Zinc finger, C2H2 type
MELAPSDPSTHPVFHGYRACRKPGCTEYRSLPSYNSGPNRPFTRKSQYTEHMRKVHDESEFPCDVPGCDRVGAKGFFRKTDLRKHKAKKHPVDAE